MAYLGNDLQVAYPTYKNIDDISGSFNSSTTSFPLRVNGVAPVPLPLNSQQCLISVGGVVQRPDDSGSEGFRLSGGNIIFASAPTTGADFFGVILAGADYINVGANFPSGTAAVPSITFDSDLDTGIFNAAANEIGFATGGVQRFHVNSAGQLNNNLGTAGAPSYSFTGDLNTGIYSPGADQVAISTNGTGRLFVNSSGSVGIGSSTPDQRLVAAGGIASTGAGNFGAGNAAGAYLSYEAGGDARLFARSVGAASYLSFWTSTTGGSSEKVRITDTGSVGIGTTSPSVPLHVQNSGTGAIATGMWIGDSSTNGNLLIFRTGTGESRIQASWQNVGVDSNLTFYTTTAAGASGERARIDASGRLLVGTSTARGDFFNTSNRGPSLQVEGTTTNTSGISVTSNQNNDNGPEFNFGKSRGTNTGSSTIVSSGDGLGRISFQGTDGSELVPAAYIEATVDGTPGNNDMPGRLVFSTTADGASSPTEAVRINNGQNLMLSQSGSGIFVGTTTDGAFRIGRSSFAVSTGTLYIGNAAIQVSSDIRLKNNIEDTSLNALEAISKIKVKDFTWNDPTDTSYNNRNARGKWTGLIAQELVEVLPFVVNAPRKEEDGSIDYESQSTWTLDQSQLCPVLIKAVQQQQEIIAALEARVAALESA